MPTSGITMVHHVCYVAHVAAEVVMMIVMGIGH
jgi:hypothetical protein